MPFPTVELASDLDSVSNSLICASLTGAVAALDSVWSPGRFTGVLWFPGCPNPLFAILVRLFARYWSLARSLSSLILSLLIEAMYLNLSESFRL